MNYYHHHVSHDHNGEIPYSSMKSQKNYIIVNYSLTKEIELFRDEYMQMLKRYGFPMPCVEMQIERETIPFAWGYGEAKNLCEWTFGNHLIRCLFVGEMMLLRTRLENKYKACPWIVCTERIETLLRFGFPQGFLVQRIEKHDVPHSSGGEYVIDTQIFQEKVETLLEYNLKRIANLKRNANSPDLYSINELYNLYKEVEAQSIVVNKEALRTQSSIDQEFITDILNRKFALQDV